MGEREKRLAAEYRKKAAACLEVADRTSLHKDRALMVEMARHWLDLAERIEAAGE